jgi:hypothetical protein
MDINEAISIANQLTNHHKAFAKLQEFIQEVLAGEVFLNELETRKAVLGAEVAALQQEREKFLKELPILRGEYDSIKKKVKQLI